MQLTHSGEMLLESKCSIEPSTFGKHLETVGLDWNAILQGCQDSLKILYKVYNSGGNISFQFMRARRYYLHFLAQSNKDSPDSFSYSVVTSQGLIASNLIWWDWIKTSWLIFTFSIKFKLFELFNVIMLYHNLALLCLVNTWRQIGRQQPNHILAGCVNTYHLHHHHQ